jgi:hypothetical protein
MQNWILVIAFGIICANPSQVNAQYTEQDSMSSDFFLGSTFFMLANLIPDDNSPEFYQINLGYRLSPKDVLSVELKTWTYRWPLGIPYGKSYEAPEEKFPGSIKEYGVALSYQHFWWKGLYAGVHVMNAWQTFRNDENMKIENGFQIFNTYRAGYHFKLFKKRFFIEPSIAITHRPYHSEMPDSFKQFDDKWSKFFFGEPGLHFGFNF